MVCFNQFRKYLSFMFRSNRSKNFSLNINIWYSFPSPKMFVVFYRHPIYHRRNVVRRWMGCAASCTTVRTRFGPFLSRRLWARLGFLQLLGGNSAYVHLFRLVCAGRSLHQQRQSRVSNPPGTHPYLPSLALLFLR